jgi:hypothetical protein
MLLKNYGHDVENTAEDLNRKFVVTFVEGSVKGNPPAVYVVRDIQSTGNKDFALLTLRQCFPPAENKKQREVGDIFHCAHADFDLIREFPANVGAANHGSTVVHTTRLGARQWRVGLCDQTAQVRIGGKQQVINISNDIAYSIYNPSYVRDHLMALEMLYKEEGRKAVAISPDYWLYRARKEIILVRNTTPLGAFHKYKFFINKPCTDFVQELWDDLHIKV